MPISTPGFAAGVTGVARALEEMEIIGGHIEWSARDVPKLIIDDADAPAGGVAVEQPFEITFSGASFTLSHCVYRRGPVTKELADITDDALEDGEQYLAVWINTSTGTAAAHLGAAIADVTDATLVPGSLQHKLLMYKIKRATNEETEAVTLTKLFDYRNMPVLVAYV